MRTLVIAFVLVAIVVFLFLGKLRSTLIPLVAVPVSMIGTFAVLLADRLLGQHRVAARPGAGHRHRGRRRHRGHRERRARHRGGACSVDPRGHQEGDGRDHRAHHRHHPGAALGVRAGRLHPRPQRPAVPPVRRRRVGLDADLGAECADPEPGALLGAAEARRDPCAADRRRSWAASTGCATAMWRSCGGWSASPLLGLVAVAAVGGRAPAGVLRITPQGFLPAEDQGAFFAAMRLPEGASLNRTEELVQQVEDIIRPMPGVQGVLSVVGLNFIDYVVSSNSAFFVVRLKPYEQRTAPRGAGRRHPGGAAAQARRRPGRHRLSLQPAAHPGARQHRRLPVRAAGPAGPVAGRPRGGDAAALIVAANQQPELAARLHHLRRRHAADLSRHRPRQGAGAGRQGERHLQRAAVDPGRLLRQRLQPVRAHLAGQRRVRADASATPSRTSTASTCATAPAPWCRSARSPRPSWCRARRSSSATTAIAAPSSMARPSRASARARRWRPWSASRPPPCRRGYGFEWTATALQEKLASGQTGIVLGLAILFAYLFLVALYESWNIPDPVLLSVSVGVLGAIAVRGAERARLRRLCPDRPRGAGGARRQERHPDRRVRRRAAAPRQERPRRRRRRRAAALPAGGDDELRLHPRPAAAGRRRGRRRRQPPRRRHAGVRRHDRGRPVRHLRHPHALRGLPAAARALRAVPAGKSRPAGSPAPPQERLSPDACLG